ncbi:MAG: hypothetical protein CBC73_03455 [Flavobacteriales bacterium TMED113]|nr:MAG: hypothetical protein CBC73_03455 [Flavobacteriales bacterium TMED113]
MNCKLVIIGNEILSGFTKEINSSFLISKLFEIGINTTKVVFINDDIKCIQSEIDLDFNLIILSGGLGPTSDDLTNEALIQFFQQKPTSFINNSIGTAPGVKYFYKGVNIIALPGVPVELKKMFTNEVIPLLVKEKRNLTNFLQVNVIGIHESKLIKLLANFESNKNINLSMSYLPENVVVKLRFFSSSINFKDLFGSVKFDLKKILGHSIFSFKNHSFEAFINKFLLKNKITLSVAESCTGGYLSHLLTSFSNSSLFFRGSVCVYSNDAKIKVLNISKELINAKTAVSEEVAQQLAEKVKEKFNTDFSLSTTGYVDSNISNDLFGIVWIACSSREKTITKMLKLSSDRKTNIISVSRLSLNLLREHIL